MLDALYEDYAHEGLLPVALLGGGTEENLAQWAAEYGYPVLLDPTGEVQARFERDSAIPSYHVVAPGSELIFVDELGITYEDLEAHLPEGGP